MMRKRIAALIAAALGASLCPQQALAVTECPVNVQSVFTGDDGSVWIIYTNSGSGVITKTDPDFDTTTSFAMSALLASRPITVRYAADGVPCTSAGRHDLVGLYLR
jgi:streptogramin lyase